jgi:hypothetical protein
MPSSKQLGKHLNLKKCFRKFITQEIGDISGNVGWDLVNIKKIFRHGRQKEEII